MEPFSSIMLMLLKSVCGESWEVEWHINDFVDMFMDCYVVLEEVEYVWHVSIIFILS